MAISQKASELIEYCRKDGRICPNAWIELYELLPNKKRNDNGGWEPPLPLILAAWHETPALLKIIRLREHILWADEHGAIDDVDNYLRSLKEEDWHKG